MDSINLKALPRSIPSHVNPINMFIYEGAYNGRDVG
jgi:hypothetical protein